MANGSAESFGCPSFACVSHSLSLFLSLPLYVRVCISCCQCSRVSGAMLHKHSQMFAIAQCSPPATLSSFWLIILNIYCFLDKPNNHRFSVASQATLSTDFARKSTAFSPRHFDTKIGKTVGFIFGSTSMLPSNKYGVNSILSWGGGSWKILHSFRGGSKPVGHNLTLCPDDLKSLRLTPWFLTKSFLSGATTKQVSASCPHPCASLPPKWGKSGPGRVSQNGGPCSSA